MTTTDAPTTPLAGATSTAERYADLSRRQAGEGDVRRAQLAAWAADVHVLEELLWENGLGEAPDPYEQLAAIGEAVASAIEALAGDAPDDLSPREVVELARHAMVTTFDASVHELLEQRLSDLAHLEQVQPLPQAPDARDRLAGRTHDELVSELRTAAADCMAVAQLMAAEGEPEAALRLARQSDDAAFEAHLVNAAVAAGDTALATVDLRWELARAAEADRAAQAHPSDAEDKLLARRDLLGSLVGSAERPALDAVLEQW